MINSALKTLVLVPAAAVVLAGTFVAAATGAAAAEYPMMKVSYDGLDLSTTEGVRKFDKRIVSAAREACSNAHQSVGVSIRDERLCIDDLVETAAAKRTIVIARASVQQRELASR